MARRGEPASNRGADLVAAWHPSSAALRVDDRLELARQAIDALDATGTPWATWLADGLALYLRIGGSINHHLGLRMGRGRRVADKALQRPRTRRDEALRQLAASLGYRTPQEAARELLRLRAQGDPALAVIHHTTAPVPTTERRLAAILREAPRK